MFHTSNSHLLADQNPFANIERIIARMGTVKEIPQPVFNAATEDFWQSFQRENNEAFPDSQTFIEKRTEQIRKETEELNRKADKQREELTKLRKELEQIRSCFSYIHDTTKQVTIMEVANEGYHKANDAITKIHDLKLSTYAA